MNATRSVGWLTLAVSTMAVATLGSVVASAHEPVVGVKDADALFTSKDPKLNRNKQAAYHIQKELLECNNWQDADKYLTEAYHQHNPMANSGRQGVVDFSTIW